MNPSTPWRASAPSFVGEGEGYNLILFSFALCSVHHRRCRRRARVLPIPPARARSDHYSRIVERGAKAVATLQRWQWRGGNG